MNNNCPLCLKDDTIQRVSSLVQAGKSSGSFSGPSSGVTYSDGKWGTVSGYSTLSGSSINDLARLLLPPNYPEKRFDMPFDLLKTNGYSCLGIAVLVSDFLGIPFGLGILLGGIYMLTKGNLQIGFTVFLFGIGYSGFTTWKILQYFKRRREAEIQFIQKKVLWDDAMTKWNRLYFCHRDGIVFDPENGTYCQPSQTQDFVYR